MVENIAVKSRTKGKHGRNVVTNYKPVFAFDYGGKSYRVESNVSQNPALFDVGEKTEIKVNLSALEEIYVPANKIGNYTGIMFVGIGAIFLTIGILLVLKSH